MSKHTQGPWKLGDYDEYLGYDCMTGGVRAGPVVLDGGDYGQDNCIPIEPDSLARLMADARLIAAAPELLEALEAYVMQHENLLLGFSCDPLLMARAELAIAKAKGESA